MRRGLEDALEALPKYEVRNYTYLYTRQDKTRQDKEEGPARSRCARSHAPMHARSHLPVGGMYLTALPTVASCAHADSPALPD